MLFSTPFTTSPTTPFSGFVSSLTVRQLRLEQPHVTANTRLRARSEAVESLRQRLLTALGSTTSLQCVTLALASLNATHEGQGGAATLASPKGTSPDRHRATVRTTRLTSIASRKWHRHKKQAAASSRSTFSPRTVSPRTVSPAESREGEVHGAVAAHRPTLELEASDDATQPGPGHFLVQLYAHAIERYASGEHATTATLRYFDKAERQHNAQGLQELLYFRRWLALRDLPWCPSNIKSGCVLGLPHTPSLHPISPIPSPCNDCNGCGFCRRAPRMRASLRTLTDVTAVDEPVLLHALPHSPAYLMLYASGLFVFCRVGTSGEILQLHLDQHLLERLGSNDLIANASVVGNQAIVVTLRSSPAVLVAWLNEGSDGDDVLRIRSVQLTSNLLNRPGACVEPTHDAVCSCRIGPALPDPC
jgi:hypothetical protein